MDTQEKRSYIEKRRNRLKNDKNILAKLQNFRKGMWFFFNVCFCSWGLQGDNNHEVKGTEASMLPALLGSRCYSKKEQWSAKATTLDSLCNAPCLTGDE